MNNALQKLTSYSQSIWMDHISRNLIQSGELQKMIIKDGLRGITSNPTIFKEAITRNHSYSASISELAQAQMNAEEIYQAPAIEDVQMAANFFFPIYKKTNGMDGFVSLEVSPMLAYDTEGTIREVRKLWKRLNRQNVMIKIPATEERLPAIPTYIVYW